MRRSFACALASAGRRTDRVVVPRLAVQPEEARSVRRKDRRNHRRVGLARGEDRDATDGA